MSQRNQQNTVTIPYVCLLPYHLSYLNLRSYPDPFWEMSALLSALALFFLGGVVAGIALEKFCHRRARQIVKTGLEQRKDDHTESMQPEAELPPQFLPIIPTVIYLTQKGTHFHVCEYCQALSGRWSQKLDLCGHCAKKYTKKKRV